MATVTIRNLPDEIHRAIRVQAAQHGRSTEAEIREILAQSVSAEERPRLGTELRHFFEQYPEFAQVTLARDSSPAEAADLS